MPNFTLQILHASDLEGGVDAIDNAKNFATIIDTLEDDYAHTVTLSAGDNYLSGPFFNAASDGSIEDALNAAYSALFGVDLTRLDAGVGRIDIAIMNIIGFDASTIGNHEFDLGSDTFESIIEESLDDNTIDGLFGESLDDIENIGALFPYLSSNLDFSGDGDLSNLFTSDILLNTDFAATPDDLLDGANPPKIAPSTIIEIPVDGDDTAVERVGVIGATTQLISTISSPTGTVETTGGENDMAALAVVIQAEIDALAAEGVDKIIVSSHLQQIALEQELAGLLSGVDVIIAGGSDSLLADDNDTLRPGDTADEDYPFQTTDLDGNPVLIVSTDGEYSYVGRLVVEFDENGHVVVDALDDTVNGAYATDEAGVLAVTGETDIDTAIDNSEKGSLVELLTDAVSDVVTSKDGAVFGETAVFIEGRREFVRTEETNMGNLTADANLAKAREFDDSVMVSIKNGGGIRAPIGEIDGLTGELLPTSDNPTAGKNAGEVSQLDIENSLRFNNGLTLVTLSTADLLEIVEHSVSASGEGATPGQFGQFGGIAFSFDVNEAPGERVQTMVLIDEDGMPTQTLVEDGEVVDGAPEAIRVVTLNFLAGGGDGYAFDTLGEDIVDTGVGEQEALADFMTANFAVGADTPFADAETAVGQDARIQQLDARSDTLDAPIGEGAEIGLAARFGGEFGEGGSEVVAYEDGKLYVTNGAADRIDVFSLKNGSSKQIRLDNLPGYDGLNSVAVKNGLIAVAVEGAALADGSVPTRGGIAIFDADTRELTDFVPAGFLPDMVTFSADGAQIYAANEAENDEDFNFDPASSITIIDVNPDGVAGAIRNVDFSAFDGQEAALRDAGVRIFPGADASSDLEPEYIAVDPITGNLIVTLQEANSVAIVDVASGEVTEILSLGVVDHSVEGFGLDANDRDDAINIQTYDNLVGIRMPDALAAFEVDGVSYFATANEGDDRNDFDEGGDAARVGDILDGDVNIFGTHDLLSIDEAVDTTGLERLTVSIVDGDTDGDGDIDVLHAYGSRSFTIYDMHGSVVFDSGDEFQKIIANIRPEFFNGQADLDDDGFPTGEHSFDNRSDNKGPEPEAITIGEVDGRTIAFIGLERDSGIMLYDISDPDEAFFVDYIDSFAGGDVSPEVITFISAEESASGKAQIAVSYELSGTTTMFDVAFAENFVGDSGNDVFSGGTGDDDINGKFGDDRLRGGAGDDEIRGGAGDDVVRGDAGDDMLKGGRGDDRVVGGGGDDNLIGGDGEDELVGGGGDDRLVGNEGEDVFVFLGDRFGHDEIVDFETGTDKIAMVATFADLTITDTADGALVTLNDKSSILLDGLAAADVTEGDFLFP